MLTKIKLSIGCFAALALIAGCVSIMEKTGQLLDGSTLAEKQIALYRASERNGAVTDMEISVVRNRNNEQSIIITMNKFPMMRLRGAMPDEDGSFYFTSLDYLAGNVHGWNEYTLQLLGGGNLVLGETAVLDNVNEIDTIQITHGRIHRYDTRITGDEALSALRNRHERISALTEWMISIDTPKNQTINNFEKHWKPVLFPETISRRHRPKDWRQNDDIFIRAEDIRWNTGYTQRVFPEELWQVRNSGTLLRDWEEALSWIYLQYEWEDIKEKFSYSINFQKIK